MSRKQFVGGVIVVLAVVMTAGTIVASNLAFKFNKTLAGPSGGNPTGTTTLSLPTKRKAGVNTAKQLMDDIGFASVAQVQVFLSATNSYLSYTGRAPNPSANNFNLTPGTSYFVRMKTSVAYIVTGSDDPGVGIELIRPGAIEGPGSGNNLIPYGYAQTAATAKQLMDDIGFAEVQHVQRYMVASGLFLTYTGRAPNPSANNFNLKAGEGYFVKMKPGMTHAPLTYYPSHY